jgi:hypothetical protein
VETPESWNNVVIVVVARVAGTEMVKDRVSRYEIANAPFVGLNFSVTSWR